VGASLLILIITTFIIVMIKRLPYLFVGWMWYAITIAPVIGIIQISVTAPYAMADRYHYLPSIGLAVMLAWGIPLLLQIVGVRKKILFSIMMVVLCLLAVSAWMQCGYWKNSIILFNHTLQVTKNNWFAYHNMGTALSAEGEIEDAVNNYSEAIRIFPNYSNAYNNRGNAYSILGQYQQAINDFNKAIHIRPNYAEAYNNYGSAYLLQGDNNLGCRYVQKACAMGVCKALEKARSNGVCR
jgi:tetratricopeptide (TPR) repeat protein